MLLLTENAVVSCLHEQGLAEIVATHQDFVRVDQLLILVDDDPEGCLIAGCPLSSPLLPCLQTERVDAGYSELVRIDGRRVCLDSVTGFTKGTPPGNRYVVRNAGQPLVSERP